MLDFDGTLSPIVRRPQEAYLPARTKKLLRQCAKCFPTAVVTGRELSWIKKTVGLNDLIYSGSHGFEWEIYQNSGKKTVSDNFYKSLNRVKTELVGLTKNYKGAFVEEKRFSLCLHYRNVSPSRIKLFFNQLKPKLAKLKTLKDLKIHPGKKMFEFKPNLNWHKGKICRMLLGQIKKAAKKPLLPFYLGDDTTDEDAFAFLKNGITVKIGPPDKKSFARYYLPRQKQIDEFLKLLLKTACQ